MVRRALDTALKPEPHLGFLVDDVEQVRAFHARATEDDLQVSAIDTNARGTMVYCRHDVVLVEVSCRRREPRVGGS